MWQLFQNVSLQSGEEFYETSGTVNFIDGEGSKPIVLHAFPDRIPEFNEFYILRLVNISGEGFFTSYLSPKSYNICFIRVVYKIQLMVKRFMISDFNVKVPFLVEIVLSCFCSIESNPKPIYVRSALPFIDLQLFLFFVYHFETTGYLW